MSSGKIYCNHPGMSTVNSPLVEQQSVSVRRPYDGSINRPVHPFVFPFQDRSGAGSVGVDDHVTIGDPVALGRPGRIASLSNSLHFPSGDVDHYNLFDNQFAPRTIESPRQEFAIRRPTELSIPFYEWSGFWDMRHLACLDIQYHHAVIAANKGTSFLRKKCNLVPIWRKSRRSNLIEFAVLLPRFILH